jgi:DNA invertase Pin-like site-specific DNA recombinase
MLEGQVEDIRRAQAQGKYRERKPTVRDKRREIETMLASGVGAT